MSLQERFPESLDFHQVFDSLPSSSYPDYPPLSPNDIAHLDPNDPQDAARFMYHRLQWRRLEIMPIKLALFHDLAAGGIASVFDLAKGFETNDHLRFQITISFFVQSALEGAYVTARGRWLIQQVVEAHKGIPGISGENMLFVLTSLHFMREWFFGELAQCSNEHEHSLSFTFWTHFGKAMGISGIPDNIEEFRRIHNEYKQKYFSDSPHPSSEKMLQIGVSLFSRLFHSPQCIVRYAIRALFSNGKREVLDGYGLKPVSSIMAGISRKAIQMIVGIAAMLPHSRCRLGVNVDELPGMLNQQMENVRKAS
jgi:hypothetical protein